MDALALALKPAYQDALIAAQVIAEIIVLIPAY
jgi:hypothetical protein